MHEFQAASCTLSQTWSNPPLGTKQTLQNLTVSETLHTALTHILLMTEVFLCEEKGEYGNVCQK